jgi:hypothetical protein
MAFFGEHLIDRLEGAIAALRLASSEPEFINMRVITTNEEGMCEIEILQQDLPFFSPFFTRTKVFDHPDVEKVEFKSYPVPHFRIIGTVQGVQSAMLRRYAYFIQREAVSFFKAVSADSLVSRKGSHLLPELWKCAKLQAQLPPKTTRYSSLPALEPIPLAMRSAASRALGPDPAPSQTPPADLIPEVSFRKYDPTIDSHINRPKTPTPTTDIPETDTPDTLPFTDDWDTTDDEDDPVDPTPLIPPNTPPKDRLTPKSPHPAHPPSSPHNIGKSRVSKVRFKFPSTYQ